ncbi:MAG: beta-N-acetylhexosaminidase [Candidatus Heimdallarchaeota archaeon]|nr:beta-N-acetylhexosaminidase [Candidatus Heimdallarchaeota archaeon]
MFRMASLLTELLANLHPLPKEVILFNKFLKMKKSTTQIHINSINRHLEQILSQELNVLELLQTKSEEKHERLIEVFLIRQKELIPHYNGYKLIIEEKVIKIIFNDDAGGYYGISTLIQIFGSAINNSSDFLLPELVINDFPDFPARGIMLDVSRDKVPTMDTLYSLIELLSSWKINQLQLYFEHTFAYEKHEIVWKNASPFTADEIKTLDKFCKEHYIELVPNQNSFGHFHRWLIHDEYRDLAECPDGYKHPFSLNKEPFSLNPTDKRVVSLLEDLYSQLLPNFTSTMFNVGLDETFDLGEGKSAEICQKKSKSYVYLEFLLKVCDLVAKFGKTIQFWADMIFQDEEIIPLIPKTTIPLLWGYEKDHPYEQQTKKLHQLGFSFYVCPGTSSWNSFTGRTYNAIENLIKAAIWGKAEDALGYLITDWGDHGHLQPLPISYIGFLVGSGLSWNSSETSQDNFRKREYVSQLLDKYIFKNQLSFSVGSLLFDIGTLPDLLGVDFPNSSGLFLTLLFPNRVDSEMILQNTTIENLEAINNKISEYLQILETNNSIKEVLAVQELIWVCKIVQISCDLGMNRIECGINRPLVSLPDIIKNPLINRLNMLIADHKVLWIKRNRIGGLEDSVRYLEKLILLLTKNKPRN